MALIEKKLEKRVPGDRPALRLVQDAPPKSQEFTLDPISREAHVRRIRWLARAFRLQWLMDQGTFHVATIECLDDAELSALLADMERARECMRDDVSFEDAGLIRRQG